MKISLEDILIFAAVAVITPMLILMGKGLGLPHELENGCIVHNHKLYCEKEILRSAYYE